MDRKTVGAVAGAVLIVDGWLIYDQVAEAANTGQLRELDLPQMMAGTSATSMMSADVGITIRTADEEIEAPGPEQQRSELPKSQR
jgi:hypothetical protein